MLKVDRVGVVASSTAGGGGGCDWPVALDFGVVGELIGSTGFVSPTKGLDVGRKAVAISIPKIGKGVKCVGAVRLRRWRQTAERGMGWLCMGRPLR